LVNKVAPVAGGLIRSDSADVRVVNLAHKVSAFPFVSLSLGNMDVILEELS
jgi:hypothetical protein